MAKAMAQQITLYNEPENLKEKLFLLNSMGIVVKRLSSRDVIMDSMTAVFTATVHTNPDEQAACARAFGHCAARHLSHVMEKLEQLLKSGQAKKSGSFFGLLRDAKLEGAPLIAFILSPS